MKRLLIISLFACLIIACQKPVEPENPVNKAKVTYSNWKSVDFNGLERFFEIQTDVIDFYGKVDKYAEIAIGERSPLLTGSAIANGIVLTFFKVPNSVEKSKNNWVSEELLYPAFFDEKPNEDLGPLHFDAIIPGYSASEYTLGEIYYLFDENVFIVDIRLTLTKFSNMVPILELQKKDVNFFSNYLKDKIKYRQVIIQGITQQELKTALGGGGGGLIEYENLVKVFKIPS